MQKIGQTPKALNIDHEPPIYKTNFERKKGRQNQIAADLESTIKAQETIEIEIGRSEKAQAIIQAVAQATQNELEYRICEPVSLALAAVYEDAP